MLNELENQFIVKIDTDEVVLQLIGEIGGEGNIDGAEFSRALWYADSLNKKVIKLHISCIGGSVLESYPIYNAILKTKTPVDTYNVGMCASSGNNIFQAGRKRYVNDYALTMVHPVSSPMESDLEMMKLFNESIIKMMMRRSNKSEVEIRAMVANTTWMNADECVANGFADEICNSSSSNKPRLLASTVDIENNLSQIKYYLNSITNKSMDMKSVTNKLNLSEGANEAQILASIEALENKAKISKDELDCAKNEAMEAENKYKELKAKYDEMEVENATKAAMEMENKVNVAIAEIKKANKVADTPEAMEALKNALTVNFDSTKLLYDSMPVNKVGVTINTNTINAGAPNATQGALAMAELRKKHNI